jgi:hypothetical protein
MVLTDFAAAAPPGSGPAPINWHPTNSDEPPPTRFCPRPVALLPQALRRLRLPLFYDSTAWVLPAGSLTHLMVTIPFWTA